MDYQFFLSDRASLARAPEIRYSILRWFCGFQDKLLYLVVFSLHTNVLGIERKLNKFEILP